MLNPLASTLPRDVIQEIDTLDNLPKAILLGEMVDEIIESTDGFLHCPLSATSTQNLKALTTLERLKLSQHLCSSLINDLLGIS